MVVGLERITRTARDDGSSSHQNKSRGKGTARVIELERKITRTARDDSSSTDPQAGLPSSGFTETDTMFIQKAHVKGLQREVMKIRIKESESEIQIRGKKQVGGKVLVGWKLCKKERRGLKLLYRIPEGVDLDRIEARYNEQASILTIFMPKSGKGLQGVGVEEVLPEKVSGRKRTTEMDQPESVETELKGARETERTGELSSQAADKIEYQEEGEKNPEEGKSPVGDHGREEVNGKELAPPEDRKKKGGESPEVGGGEPPEVGGEPPEGGRGGEPPDGGRGGEPPEGSGGEPLEWGGGEPPQVAAEPPEGRGREPPQMGGGSGEPLDGGGGEPRQVGGEPPEGGGREPPQVGGRGGGGERLECGGGEPPQVGVEPPEGGRGEPPEGGDGGEPPEVEGEPPEVGRAEQPEGGKPPEEGQGGGGEPPQMGGGGGKPPEGGAGEPPQVGGDPPEGSGGEPTEGGGGGEPPERAGAERPEGGGDGGGEPPVGGGGDEPAEEGNGLLTGAVIATVLAALLGFGLSR